MGLTDKYFGRKPKSPPPRRSFLRREMSMHHLDGWLIYVFAAVATIVALILYLDNF
jgi:hypothetical protein